MNYEIVCVVNDKNRVIIKVGLSHSVMKRTIEEIRKMMANGDIFHTLKRGMKAKVYAKQHPSTGRWFLTTSPDSIEENNLDFLPECKMEN